MAVITAAQAGGQNRVAFLDAVAGSEIGPALLKVTDNGYDVLVGASPAHPLTFPSYQDHPNVFNAALNSTAAGYKQLSDFNAATTLSDANRVGVRVHSN